MVDDLWLLGHFSATREYTYVRGGVCFVAFGEDADDSGAVNISRQWENIFIGNIPGSICNTTRNPLGGDEKCLRVTHMMMFSGLFIYEVTIVVTPSFSRLETPPISALNTPGRSKMPK